MAKQTAVATVIIGLVVVLFAQQPSQRVSGPVQRYQIVSGKVREQEFGDDAKQELSLQNGKRAENEPMVDVTVLFLVDTQAGEVWRYQGAHVARTSEGLPFGVESAFYHVPVIRSSGGK
ncbi:MAG: hypothetical protein WAL32_17025 [Terriglobales bacterium]